MSGSRKKLLLMGRSGSGKSSMRSIIFSNYSAFDTRRLGATIDVEHSHLRFLGNMSLNLWDCGGQDVFMDNYFTSQKDHIFTMVEVLIHVFDVESKQVNKDIDIFIKSLEQLSKYSPNAKIFVLLHKMDLVQLEKRDHLFEIMMGKLEQVSNKYKFNVSGFATSIWDESLYKAWSYIVCSLIPNMNLYENNLLKFNQILEAEEIILFEKTTFLVITSTSSKSTTTSNDIVDIAKRSANKNLYDEGFNDAVDTNGKDSGKIKIGASSLDPKRFEKISNIIKNFKQSVTKMRTGFKSLVLHGSYSDVFIDVLTENMFIMIVLPKFKQNTDGVLRSNEELLVLENVSAARKWFEKIENVKF